jgi:hypothetical protein
MRINFKGPFTTIDPIVIAFSAPGSFTFDPSDYPDHIFYDVIVIGAGGGYGGGMAGEDPSVSGNMVTAFGGAGGGGGFHRRRGLMELLGGGVTVLVGAAGTDGADGTDTVAGDDGGDGGPSKFGDFVLATGGKGGKGAQSIDSTANRLSHGGQGGIGGTEDLTAGGGAFGGVCGLASGTPDEMISTPGQDGPLISSGRFYIPDTDTYTLKGLVGKGGGGGPGGAYFVNGSDYERQSPYAEAGGKGSYNSDGEVFDPGSKAVIYVPTPGVSLKVKPGRGGGARVTPLNNTNAVYGGSGRNGAVFIRLSLEVDGSLG